MICAILAGQKTQTRRLMSERLYVEESREDGDFVINQSSPDFGRAANAWVRSPYGVPGDRLTVKEAAWMWCERQPNGTTKTGRPKWLYVPLREAPVTYAADAGKPSTSIVSPETGNEWGWRLKIGRFLPRWASRITLEVAEVRAERLQSITEADARAEGVTRKPMGIDMDTGAPLELEPARAAFAALWDSINGKRAPWTENPWIWVVSFRRVTP
jgi:hypothetical protein